MTRKVSLRIISLSILVASSKVASVNAWLKTSNVEDGMLVFLQCSTKVLKLSNELMTRVLEGKN